MLNVVIAALLSGIFAQTPQAGRTIATRDGDTVIINNSDKVRVVRRREGNLRAIFDPDQRILLILVDSAGANGAPPDGRVDVAFTLRDVQGEWPLDLRWEGRAILDDYLGDGGPIAAGSRGFTLSTSSGLVQMFNGPVLAAYRNPSAIATLGFRGNGRSLGSGTFDQEEQFQVAQIRRNQQMMTNSDGSPRFRLNATMGMEPVPGGAERTPMPPPPPSAPVRVGSFIKTPVKLVHVDAVMPEAARQAGIYGMVILEATIGADGAVKDVKVLRSIPMLDAPAIEAVRQWRYEPTMLNGAPVAVIMTVTVNFLK